MRLAQRELQRQARTDALTGLLNRRGFDEHLGVIWRQAEREKAPVGIVLLDVDGFKQLNDSHGHAAGDDVLRHVAGVLKTYASRPLDAVGRYGGDEFVVVWYNADAQRFAALSKLLTAKLQVVGTHGFTISGGAVICRPDQALSIKDALLAADERLYAAKRTSRGEILVDDLSLKPIEGSRRLA
jgi:diguanylate cyclase (GGDEF)-like protein